MKGRQKQHVFQPQIYDDWQEVCKICAKSFKECQSWVKVWSTGSYLEEENESDDETVLKGTTEDLRQVAIPHPEFDFNVPIVQMISTSSNSFIHLNSGELYSWGTITECLGQRDEGQETLFTPRLIEQLNIVVIVAVTTGANHVLALESGMYIWSWGSNSFGQLGTGDQKPRSLPQRIPHINKIIRIQCSQQSSFALDNNENMFVWGDNRYGQLTFENEHQVLSPQKLNATAWKSQSSSANAQNRKYFKQKQVKELTINGINLTMLNQILSENQELQNRIRFMQKKLDVLEDMLMGTSNKLFQNNWDVDPLLGDIDEILSKFRRELKKLAREYDELRGEHKVKREEYKEIEEQKLKLVESNKKNIEEIQKLQLSIQKKSNEKILIEERAGPQASEKIRFEIEQEKMQKERLHVQEHSNDVKLQELQDNLQNIQDEIDHIQNLKAEMRKEKKIVDYRRNIFKKMRMVRRKSIADRLIFSNSGESTSLYHALQYVIKCHKVIQQLDQSEFSQIDPHITTKAGLNFSNFALIHAREMLQHKISPITNLKSVQIMNSIWRVLIDNSNTMIQNNRMHILNIEQIYSKYLQFMNANFSELYLKKQKSDGNKVIAQIEDMLTIINDAKFRMPIQLNDDDTITWKRFKEEEAD